MPYFCLLIALVVAVLYAYRMHLKRLLIMLQRNLDDALAGNHMIFFSDEEAKALIYEKLEAVTCGDKAELSEGEITKIFFMAQELNTRRAFSSHIPAVILSGETIFKEQWLLPKIEEIRFTVQSRKFNSDDAANPSFRDYCHRSRIL